MPTAVPPVRPEVEPYSVSALPSVALHEPPGDASENTAVSPKQSVDGPEIGAGTGFIVTTAVVRQAEGDDSM